MLYYEDTKLRRRRESMYRNDVYKYAEFAAKARVVDEPIVERSRIWQVARPSAVIEYLVREP